MKRTTLPLLLAAALLGQVANAQTSSTTPVIGYYKADVPAGASSWVCGFVTKKDFQGAATSITPGTPNSVINQTGATFGTFTNSYVEILSGAQTGLILDIVSNTGTTITVEGNTTGVLTGTETYCVRKHATLGTVLASGGGLAPNEDIVILIDSAGTESNAVYDGAGAWFDLVTAADLTNTAIYPGQGFVILANAPRVMTIGGNDVSYVKSGPTKISLYAFIPNLVGLVNPLVATNPADPIYSTSGVTTAENFGLKTIAPNSDLVIKPTLDGVFDTQFNFIFDGTNITDLISGGDLDNDPIRNGTSLIFVPDANKAYTLPQTHP